MSIITRAVVSGENELSCGHAYGIATIWEAITDVTSRGLIGVEKSRGKNVGKPLYETDMRDVQLSGRCKGVPDN
jgi:hypothetical protein